MDHGHWQYDKEIDIDEWFGFVYRIIDIDTNQEYIGKKSLWSRRTLKPLKGTKRKRKVVKESNWKKYTSSSKYVNEAISKKGIGKFRFEIIELCKTGGDLSYREVEIQWKEKVLESTLPNGLPKYYNKAIGNIKFTLSKYSLKSKKQMSKKMIGNKNAVGAIRSKETKDKISKARIGMDFTDSHKKNIAKARKKQVFTKETQDKKSVKMSAKNWYNNGTNNIRLSKDDVVPQGFKFGMLPRKSVSPSILTDIDK